MTKTERIISTILGHIPPQLDLMVVTPILSIYHDILKYFPDGIEKKGFYPNALVAGKGGKRCMIVCISQGIQGQDICCAVPPCKILFLGYAGGISKDVAIGNIYEAGRAFTPEGKVYRLQVTGCFPKVDCGYSPAMLGTPAAVYGDIARNMNCHVIDMETSYCAMAAAEYHHYFISWLLVTDKPGERDFWEIDTQESNRIRRGKQKLLEQAVCSCKEALCNG